MATTWDGVRDRTRDELTRLDDAQFLVVGEPEAAPGPPRGLLRRRTRPAATRYVQARRDGDHWYVECVGATSFGGDLEIAPAAHQRLRDLGWLLPGEDDGSGMEPSYPNYWRLLALAETAVAADLCTGALAALGAEPGTLEWRSGE